MKKIEFITNRAGYMPIHFGSSAGIFAKKEERRIWKLKWK